MRPNTLPTSTASGKSISTNRTPSPASRDIACSMASATAGSRPSNRFITRPQRTSEGAGVARAVRPVSVANTRRASATEWEKTPIVSNVGDSGNTPSVDQMPRLGLKPTTPQSAAGSRTEPPVSVPIENAHNPAANAAADPWLDPPHTRLIPASQGFHGIVLLLLIVAAANSVVFVFPSRTQPCCFSASTNGP